MSLALLAIIFSAISILANMYILRHWIVCVFKGHRWDKVMHHVDGSPHVFPRCRRCGL